MRTHTLALANIYKRTYDEWSPKGRKWGLIDGHITWYNGVLYLYIYILYEFGTSHHSLVRCTQCSRTHTLTHTTYPPTTFLVPTLACERGNSHLRATIKTIDDWRGHLDLKIYLRGSASHSHTHTHVARTLKRDWIIDQLSHPRPIIPRDHFPPSPALCRCLARAVYIRYIDGASNYEISYFISTPTPSHPRASTVRRRHLRPHTHTHTLLAPPLILTLFASSASNVHPLDPPRSFTKSVKTSPS